MIRKICYEAGIVLLISIGLTIGAYGLRPDTLPLISNQPQETNFDNDGSGLNLMTLDQVMDLFANGVIVIFADARSKTEYNHGHIQGAINLPPHEEEIWAGDLIANKAPDQLIITYCDGEHCSLAQELAEKLTLLGFENVHYLKDGWNQWKARQLPIATGEQD
jgi:rhodanese-related sulfurtransferase